MNDKFQSIIDLFSSLQQCEESNVCILTARDLENEDLLETICYEAWVYDRSFPLKGMKASAIGSVEAAIDELYSNLYQLALNKKKESGDVFPWMHQKAFQILSTEKKSLSEDENFNL